MIKQQSNIKFDLLENDDHNQRFAIKHDCIVNSRKKSEISIDLNRDVHKIQETNINPIEINVLEKSTSSHCSLIETSLKERIDKYLNKNKLSFETKENLNKLQKITDDVKLLTKQLQLSIKINKNNNNNNSSSSSSSITLDERLLGEICYQLERRILNLIFSSSKQFYGYSLRYLPLIIEHEENKQQYLLYKKRFLHIKNYLLKANFHFDYHSILTFSLINQYGIYFDYQWLENNSHILSNINQIKSFYYSIFSQNFHHDFNIILHSLELISKIDGKPLFYW